MHNNAVLHKDNIIKLMNRLPVKDMFSAIFKLDLPNPDDENFEDSLENDDTLEEINKFTETLEIDTDWDNDLSIFSLNGEQITEENWNEGYSEKLSNNSVIFLLGMSAFYDYVNLSIKEKPDTIEKLFTGICLPGEDCETICKDEKVCGEEPEKPTFGDSLNDIAPGLSNVVDPLGMADNLAKWLGEAWDWLVWGMYFFMIFILLVIFFMYVFPAITKAMSRNNNQS
jgi:hypothetical protein